MHPSVSGGGQRVKDIYGLPTLLTYLEYCQQFYSHKAVSLLKGEIGCSNGWFRSPRARCTMADRYSLSVTKLAKLN